jgi:hypothetical protein
MIKLETPNRYKPVPDSVFQVYKEQFSYDKTDLNPRTEWRHESSEDWVQEKITFNAAYGNERVIAYLFLPQKNPPPFQAVIYFPDSGAVEQTSSEHLEKYAEFDYTISFILKSGRAVLFPIYKGTFERGPFRAQATGYSPRQELETGIEIVRDFKRSIDYLETRPDIDSKRLAFAGLDALGGMFGPIIPAVEDRLKVNIIYNAGLATGFRPEITDINYLPRIKIPTLMLNCKYNMLFPYETSVKPMFDLLGTPKDQKVLKLYDTDDYIPRNELIKESLAWLDRYLGPVERRGRP